MKKQQSGFTLIELIAVIVILGILAATALPRFIDLSEAAKEATAKGVAGALGSAAAMNHASAIALNAGLTAADPRPVSIATCGDVVPLLDGGLDEDYVVDVTTTVDADGAVCTVAFDTNGNNTFDASDEPTATFTAYAATVPAP